MSLEDIDIDAAVVNFAAAMTQAIDLTTRSLKKLVAAGIRPISEHQDIAYLWATGEMSDADFLATARLISLLHGSDDAVM